jgi:hypothetical protein
LNVDDIIQVTLRGTLYGQRVLNVFHYKVTDVTGAVDYDLIAGTCLSKLTSDITPIQVSAMTWERCDLDNLTDGLSFGSATGTFNGVLATEGFAPFAAWYFRLNRSTKLTRSGGKRIAGVPENEVSNGTAESSFIPTLAVAAGEMLLPINWNFLSAPVGSGSMELGILGRNPDGTFDLSRFNGVSGIEYVSVSTQNSRKFGRGT